jgi:flagellar protein FlaJ
MFGGYAAGRTAQNARLELTLQRAHIPKRPDVYLATTYLTTSIVMGASLLGAILVAAVLLNTGNGVFPALLYLAPMPVVVAGLVYVINLVLPDLRAATRARDIDAKLPYAINYIATMAAAGATPPRIFRSLSQQDIYGEAANEAAWIARDMDLLGADILTALGQAITRSPSVRFQDFLQGAITTLSTGGDLEDYFTGKSEQFLLDNRQLQDRFLDSLGVLAEAFVVVVVAAPLFLLVMLSVMASFGGDARGILRTGYILILVMLPLAQIGFAVTVSTSTPEA